MKNIKSPLIKACLIILILCFLPIVRAQELSHDFGKLGKAEAEMTTCPGDKSAEAVILFKIGKSYFEESERNFDVIYEETTRLKILNEAGLKWAEVEIPFYQEGGIFEQVYDIEAYTYNPSGDSFTRTQLDLSTCHDEKLNEYWLLKKFALPDVKPGSIIEYRYKINSQYKFNLRNWEFQARIPTIYSEYEVRIIPFYEYVYVLQGAKKFDSNTSYEDSGITRAYGPVNFHDIINKFVMKNVPAFNDEEYITSINDYLIKLDFQLSKIHTIEGTEIKYYTTWPDLVKELLKETSVTKFAAKCEKLLPKVISPDSLVNKSPQAKFDYILNFVKTNFTWDNYNSIYASKTPNELLKDKTGNNADLNLLLIGLLNAAGIQTSPVLLSTREHGKIKLDYPLLSSFNYLVADAILDGKSILTDATDIYIQNNRIPSKCLNDKGLVIKDGPVEWLSLYSNTPSEVGTTIRIDSIGTNSHAQMQISATEYDGLKYRRTYGIDKKKIVDRENVNDYTIDELSIDIKNQDRKELPYCLNYSTSYKTETVNNKIYISPFLGEPISDNPLKQDNRSYPVDMSYPVKRIYSTTINIPAGYKVDFMPADDKILNDLFELNYNIKNEGNSVNVVFNYTFKKSIYNASDYQNLKYYFKEIIKKTNEKLVLAKTM